MESELVVRAQFINTLINALPGLVVWITALVFSIIVSRRGSGKPERFLIAGSSLMLAGTVLNLPKQIIADSLAQSSLNNVNAAAVISGINLFLGLISLAGVICLFYSIWKKFNESAKVISENR